MTSQLIIRVDDELKKKVSRFAMAEGKTASQVVREMLEQYVSDHDIGGYIDQLWDRIGRKMKEKGVGPEDVQQALSDARKSR
jgi:predicted transcriptional regulator